MSEIRAMSRRVMNMVVRGVIEESNDEPGMQQVQISLLRDEGKVAVERFQNYGFSSHPPANSEVLCVFVGGGRDHGVIVATDDRASRFTGLAAGEVAVYNSDGDSIVLKGDNSIEFTTRRLVIHAEDRVEIECPEIKIAGSDGGDTRIDIKGDIHLDGNLDATGSINAPQGGVGT
jgi:phage baseplate assembly protein V